MERKDSLGAVMANLSIFVKTAKRVDSKARDQYGASDSEKHEAAGYIASALEDMEENVESVESMSGLIPGNEDVTEMRIDQMGSAVRSAKSADADNLMEVFGRVRSDVTSARVTAENLLEQIEER